jgi:O-antigen/teichoic acid export membrane protein
MVLFFLGAEASGVYALMMTLANGLQTIRNGFNPIITPVVSGMDESRLKTDLKPVYSYCVSMATMIQVIIGFFIVLFPEEIMSIAGKSYVVQPMALGILLFFQLVVTFFGMVNTVIDGIGKSVVNLKASVIQLLTSVVAGFILIPQFGLLGAALSMLIYGIVSSVYCNVYLLKRSLQPYSSNSPYVKANKHNMPMFNPPMMLNVRHGTAMVTMDFQIDLPVIVYSVLRLKIAIATSAPKIGPRPVESWKA